MNDRGMRYNIFYDETAELETRKSFLRMSHVIAGTDGNGLFR